MKHAARSLILAVTFLVLSLPAHAGGTRALLIGISQYQNIDSLKFADADARKFSQILTDFAGYERADVTVLLNREATKQRITDEIYRVVRDSEKQPLEHFILMFAGHGLPRQFDARDTHAFLAPFDATTDANTFYSTGGGKEVANETFINRAWLARQLSAINARTIVIILDSCYSGNKVFGELFFENMGYSVKSFAAGNAGLGLAQRNLVISQASVPNGANGARKIAYLASSREDQPSAEYDALRHGALSYSIFESIKRAQNEAYVDDRKELSVDNVYADINRLFREIKVQGKPLGDVHQPFLLPLPEPLVVKDMTFLRVAGVRPREPRNGFLEIVTDPPGLEIFVNGIKRPQVTNATLELPEGRHHVELYLPNTAYRHSFTTDIRMAQTTRERLSMRGELRVESFWLRDGQRSSGPALDVYLNGSRITQGQRVDNLIAGTHELRVRFQSVEKTRRIEIRPDSPLQVNYSIIRQAAPQRPRGPDPGRVPI
jgi:uncharacterized caspase-like protein